MPLPWPSSSSLFEHALLSSSLWAFAALHSARTGVPEFIVEANVSTLCRLALLVCLTVLLVGFAPPSKVEARQGFGGFFFSSFWFYRSPPWRHRYYASPRKRYYAHSRRRKAVRSERRRFSQSANRRAALAVAKPRKAARIAARDAVPNDATGALPITCEKAQAIVAEFGFKQIEAELCIGENFEFHATRDGKPFLIEIEAANGELAKVQRLR